jgi:hypothetical protein
MNRNSYKAFVGKIREKFSWEIRFRLILNKWDVMEWTLFREE